MRHGSHAARRRLASVEKKLEIEVTAISQRVFRGEIAGDPGRARTCDLPLRRRLLYPLSYGAAIGRWPVAILSASTGLCGWF
jgi:hypothetical protein